MDTKPITLDWGRGLLEVNVPVWADILTMPTVVAVSDPADAIERALSHPIGCPGLEQIVAAASKPASELQVAVTVSDNTRPVPYNSDRGDGILMPILRCLHRAGVRARNVVIVVGTGTHQATSARWKLKAFGKAVTDSYRILDHDARASDLVEIGSVRGVNVRINQQFMNADLRIATGLVEPHFMAGVSGGRKAICPGLVNLEATRLFHGPGFMAHPSAASLVLDGNPCHDFALEVARRVGVHFSVNAVLNRDMQFAGVFAGALEDAHRRAVEMVHRHSLVRIEREYDVVLTHGGEVAVNHYQAVKAAHGSIPVVKQGGIVVLAAHNGDPEPVGNEDYKRVMAILMDCEPGKFTDELRRPEWEFIPDQWDAQKWDQFFDRIDSFRNLIYCTLGIEPNQLAGLPLLSGWQLVPAGMADINQMVQNALEFALKKAASTVNARPSLAVVREGPYAVFSSIVGNK